MPTRRAVLYLRLSSVSDASTSIERQERDLRARAVAEGWRVVAVLVDEGISGRKERPKAAEAVRMIADGEAEVLAVTALDRFSRAGATRLGPLLDALAARPEALFVSLKEGDSSDSTFRLRTVLLAEIALQEAENTAHRQRNAIAHRRTVSDRYTGGAVVPFGYISVPASEGAPGRILVPDGTERALVREVADRLLAHVESLTAIAADLTRRGVPTSKSPARRALRRGEPWATLERGTWTVSGVRTLWASDSLVGRVTHHGDLIRDADGLPRSVWEPLTDLDTLERLRDRLGGDHSEAARRRMRRRGLGLSARTDETADEREARLAAIEAADLVTTMKPRPARRRAARLLSGVALCTCGTPLYVTTSGGRPVYACPARRNDPTSPCPGPRVNAEAVEDHVVDLFLRVAGAAPEQRVEERVSSPGTAAALREVEAQLRSASAAMLDETSDVAALSARIVDLRRRRADLRSVPSTIERVLALTGRTLADAWEADLDIEARRGLLAEAVQAVVVGRGVRGAFAPSRVSVYWQERIGSAETGEGESRGPGNGPRRLPRAERQAPGEA